MSISAGYELQFSVGMRRTFYTWVARAALAGPRIVKDHETEIQTGYRNYTYVYMSATFKAYRYTADKLCPVSAATYYIIHA